MVELNSYEDICVTYFLAYRFLLMNFQRFQCFETLVTILANEGANFQVIFMDPHMLFQFSLILINCMTDCALYHHFVVNQHMRSSYMFPSTVQ